MSDDQRRRSHQQHASPCTTIDGDGVNYRHRSRASAIPNPSSAMSRVPAPSANHNASTARMMAGEPAASMRVSEPAPDRSNGNAYDVGYAKPPVATRFRPGHSGNPKGRPKASKNTATIARELLDEQLTITKDGKRQKQSVRRIMIHQQIKKAVEKGCAKASTYVFHLAGEGPIPTSRNSPPPIEHEVCAGLTAGEYEILAFQQREAMLAQGLPEETIQNLLRTLGLVPSNDVDASGSSASPDDRQEGER